MFSVHGNKTHSLLIGVLLALGAWRAASAQDLVTEKIDILGEATLISFLEKWKGGIDAVDVASGSDGHMILTVTGWQTPHPSHHIVITVEGGRSRIREFADEEEAETFAENKLAELAGKYSSKTEVFPLMHANASELVVLLSNIIRNTRLAISAHERGNTLVATAPPGVMEIVRNTIARLDTPAVPEPLPKNVKITAYLLEGSMDSSDPGKVPAILERVVKELSGTFQYSQYRLLDTLLVRTREGRPARTAGSLPATVSSGSGEYSFSFEEAVVREFEDTQTVQLVDLNLRGVLFVMTRSDTGEITEHHEFTIAVDVDIREGQKVVVGKANLSGPDRAMFFVLTAEILD